MRTFVRIAWTLMLVTLSYSVLASEQTYDGPPLKADYEGPILLDNTRFFYTGEDRLRFSTAEWLGKHAPELLPLRPVIDTWASRLGIHPRVLSAVVGDYFAGTRVTGERRDVEAVVEVASALEQVFTRQAGDPLAATRAVVATADAMAFELRLSPALAKRRPIKTLQKGPIPTLFGYFQPPWEIGDTWAGGGAHGDTGSGLQNALDFWGEFRQWGEDLSQWWVAAIQGGTARVWSSCGMSIVHANGWVSDYYHLDDIQVADFAQVERNDRIAHYANTEAQALCAGGGSTGPHVHMSIEYNGQRVLIDESVVDFTAFSHHVGNGQYDGNCSTSWYTHFSEGQICPFFDQLLNDAPVPSEIFIDDFESGNVLAWSPSS